MAAAWIAAAGRAPAVLGCLDDDPAILGTQVAGLPVLGGREWLDHEDHANVEVVLADELPEMWNVLRGEMSLVGPGTLLVEYLERYSPEQARRHEVRTGITRWSQVTGRGHRRRSAVNRQR